MVTLALEDSRKIFDAHLEHGHLFLFTIKSTTTICRPLTISEIEAIAKLGELLSNHHLDDIIFEKCVVYTSLTGDEPAGYVSSIAESVLIRSSSIKPEDISQDIHDARDALTTIPGYIEAASVINCKNITVGDFRSLNKRQQFKYYALAELINPELKKNDLVSDLGKEGSKSSKRSVDPQLSAEARRITSESAADKPNIDADNAALRGMLS